MNKTRTSGEGFRRSILGIGPGLQLDSSASFSCCKATSRARLRFLAKNLTHAYWAGAGRGGRGRGSPRVSLGAKPSARNRWSSQMQVGSQQHNTEALIITYTMLEVPFWNSNIPKYPILILKAPLLNKIRQYPCTTKLLSRAAKRSWQNSAPRKKILLISIQYHTPQNPVRTTKAPVAGRTEPHIPRKAWLQQLPAPLPRHPGGSPCEPPERQKWQGPRIV